MSDLSLWLMGISFLGTLAVLGWAYTVHKNLHSLMFQLCAVLIAAVLLYQGFYVSGQITPKGSDLPKELPLIIALYVFMILGMFSNFCYARFSRPKSRRGKFDAGRFFAPIFPSPIVFIPLMVAFQEAKIDMTQFTASKMMIFLVAFQNGFFWEEYFYNLRKEKKGYDENTSDGRTQQTSS